MLRRFNFSFYKNIAVITVASLTFLATHQASGLTDQDEERIRAKVKYAKMSVARYKKMVASLEQKFTEALDREEEAREHYEKLQGQAASAYDLDMAEKGLYFASNRVESYATKLDNVKQKLAAAEKAFEAASRLEDKMVVRRSYEHYKRRFDNAQRNLADYKKRVYDLEIEERETRAAALANSKLAIIGHSEMERRIAGWKADMFEKKADAILADLAAYREKVKESMRALDELEPLFRKAEEDIRQFEQSSD